MLAGHMHQSRELVCFENRLKDVQQLANEGSRGHAECSGPATVQVNRRTQKHLPIDCPHTCSMYKHAAIGASSSYQGLAGQLQLARMAISIAESTQVFNKMQ